MTSLHHSFQPSYLTDREEEENQLIKCDCCFECGSYRPTQMLEGYEGEMFFAGHKESYLDNYKGTLLNEDLKLLTDKINKQL